MTIALTGLPGSGKSSVGRELAALLGCLFIDLDEYIAHKAGENIADILAESEDRFRAIEAEALRDVVIMRRIYSEDAVVALGGGTVLNPESRRLLKSQCECVYLRTKPDSIAERLGESDSTRPLYSAKGVEALLGEREEYYMEAVHTVDTDGKTVSQTASEIKALLGL